MLPFLQQLGPWAWIIAGLILLGVEILAPGAFFVWFGLAALVVGAIGLVAELQWQAEAILFVALAILFVLIGRRVYARPAGDGRELNDRASRLVGGVYALSEPIRNGTGRVRIDDSTWTVSGPDLPEGSRVRVTGADGAVLTVEAA